MRKRPILHATIGFGDASHTFLVSGRDARALQCLKDASERGVTPIDTPGPRWSGYVFNLRWLGIDIETIHKSHGGPFPGSHARYVLRSHVSLLDQECEAA